MGVIQRLPPDVVNRMAAGEILARPCNAVKELVENSLDAGATEIVVTLQNSGLKLLQVQDNGKGIARDDFELACERFATSKLEKFEDLAHMKTYGFRGEALASLSHVSKVNIVSKQADSACAYQANFVDGKMMAPTKPSAGKNGTCVTATDLFYNLPQRRNKMATHNEEAKMVFDTIMRFAIHRPDVSFALRQNASSDFRTRGGDASLRDVVSLLLGRDVADALVNLHHESTRLKFAFGGVMSRPISAATASLAQHRKTRNNVFSVFINGRSVRSDILKQPLDEVLSRRALVCQFCAVDLKIDETRVDVNVHPTKSSVLFLEKDEIVDEIRGYIEKLIGEMFGDAKNSPPPPPPAANREASPKNVFHFTNSIEVLRRNSLAATSSFKATANSQIEKKRVDYMEIRTDSKERKMDEFVVRCRTDSEHAVVDHESIDEISMVSIGSQEADESQTMTTTRREFDYESLMELRREICEAASPTLREMFKSFSFVGAINPELVLVQFGTALYSINFAKLLAEFFYQAANHLDSVASPPFRAPIGESAVSRRPTRHPSGLRRGKGVFFADLSSRRRVFHVESTILREKREFRRVISFLSKKILAWFSAFCDASWKLTISKILIPAIRKKLIPPERFKQENVVQLLADAHDLYKVFERCGT
ncbi:unnamed protein product [Caenorhabditis bovis]|uniref:DNA mismatch repair protein S5 domain-containing protein n=1 Tax=Caenorhabditis bovis TaxID=2654633 RepID=A0A8S1EUZ1_9PELO|nr:unnamed protein product [Caenorhabditis bovis]